MMKLRKNKTKIFLVVTATMFLLLMASVIVSANQPYTGGYLDESSDFTTKRTLMGVDIGSVDLSDIPSNGFVGPVMSVAGGDPSRSGYVYQGGIAIHDDGSCIWAPQIWNSDGPVDYYESDIGEYNYSLYYVESRGISDGKANFKAFSYKDEQDVIKNTPYIYYYESSVDTGDTRYRVGYDTISNHRLRYFQFGVEATTSIPDWDIGNFSNSYYDSSANKWKYLPGTSVRGSDASITEDGENVLGVGGNDYQNVDYDPANTTDDQVWWEYTSSTVNTGETLWSSSGDVTLTPYE